MIAGMTHQQLLDCMLALEPLEIKAVTLHRDYKAAGTMPSKDELGAAVRQLQTYGERCRDLSRKVQQLPAVPALDTELVKDFPL